MKRGVEGYVAGLRRLTHYLFRARMRDFGQIESNS